MATKKTVNTPKKKTDMDYTNKRKCACCGKWRTLGTETSIGAFYRSSSRLYKGYDGLMVHCKDCVIEEYDRIASLLTDEKGAVKATCMRFNICFDEKVLEGAFTQTENSSNVIAISNHLFRNYMKLLNSLGTSGDLGRVDSDFNTIEVLTKTEEVEKKEEALSPQERMNRIQKESVLTDEEELAKQDCCILLGYDPFIGCSIFDQKYLYVNLLPQLNEDVLEDGYLLAQYIQIINNNNQIRKIDLTINLMSGDISTMLKNQGDIKSLTSTKKQIVENNDKIAKENSISLKNRGDKKAGKSTLTYLMRNLRELGFEDAEADYYDELKSYGMQKASEASATAIFGQLRLTESDYADVIENQRDMIQKMTKQLDDLKEENRALYAERSEVGGR